MHKLSAINSGSRENYFCARVCVPSRITLFIPNAPHQPT